METFGGAVLQRVPRQARSRDKVEQALAAAERLLRRHGADALTITRVAAEAGVTVGALHQYLPDHDAIVRALLTRYHARFEQLTAEIVRRADPAQDTTHAIVGAFAAVYRASGGLRALGEGRDDPESRAHKARMVDLTSDLLAAHGIEHTPAVARTTFTAADALLHDAFRDDPAGDPALLAELELLLRAYLGL